MNMHNLNNYKFLNKKNVLFISNDTKLSKKIEDQISMNLNSFINMSNLSMVENFYIFDLIILDADMIQFDSYCELIQFKANNIPIMFISSNLSVDTLKYSSKIKLRNVILKDNQIEYIKFYILMILDKSTIVHFNDGYYYDLNNDSFYSNSKKIKLTNMENNLLKYLIENRNKIVTYEEIEKNVWKDKRYSKYTMRNVINQIREKAYYNIINNQSKNGYSLKDYYIFS